MKKSNLTEEQIAFALRQADSGTRVAEVCRKTGHRRASFSAGKRSTGILASRSSVG